MCFSAPASFVSSAVLITAGVASLNLVKRKTEIPLAMIPLFFGLQQFSEGWLWLFLGSDMEATLWGKIATWGFLFFAFLIWPFWTPFSMLLIEKATWRKFFMGIILLIGAFVTYEHFMYALSFFPSVKIVGQSIQYQGNVPDYKIPYAIAVILPCLLSSWRFVWLFGVLVAAAYFVADIFFYATFVSVWCFFSALVSALIYFAFKLRDDQ